MNKKASLELSINFIVKFILAIAVFSLGIFIMVEIVTELNKMKNDLDQRTIDQIESQLSRGADVAFGIKTKDIAKGDFDHFYLGIKNIDGEEGVFSVDVYCDMAEGDQGDVICDIDGGIPCDVCSNWVTILESEFNVSSNIREAINIYVSVPKKSIDPDVPIVDGTYNFNVQVYKDGEEYDTLKEFNVNV